MERKELVTLKREGGKKAITNNAREKKKRV